ncbi:MAG: glycosyltransferase family 2 protein [Clostridia bacterium]|nr:glycosyltransferase family 2 protein [Clostridia bacterium]
MFSIVTANWNGAKYLQIYLASLEDQTYKNFTLYLIDNGSTDDSLRIIQEFSERITIRLIRLKENLGFARANNIGVSEAMKDDSKYIITFNNDLELENICLERIASAIEEPAETIGAYQVLMINHYERHLIDAAGLKFNRFYDANQIALKLDISLIPDLDVHIDGVCAGAAVYAKDALDAIRTEQDEFFDEKYFAYYEDVDLALRLSRAGYLSKLIKDAIVYHVHSGTSGAGTSFKEYYLSRNNLIYRRKNMPQAKYNKYKLRFFLQSLKNLARHLLKGRLDLFRAALRGYSDFVRHRY